MVLPNGPEMAAAFVAVAGAATTAPLNPAYTADEFAFYLDDLEARALLVEPSYVMMDEPFSTLDELTARTLRQEIIDIWQRTGVTIVFVTHSIREATFLADRIIILTRGPANVDDSYSVPIDRPRDYEEPRIGQVEAEIVKRVLGVWELEKT